MTRRIWQTDEWVSIEITEVPDSFALIPVDLMAYNSTVGVSTSATANTKGGWTGIVTSTSANVNLINLIVGNTGVFNAVNTALVDIGIGGSGSEVPLVENIAVPACATNTSYFPVSIPVSVPAGSRLSVRWQSSRTSAAAAAIRMNLYDYNNSLSPSSVTTIGANTGTSAGVGLTVDTMTEIEDSTTEDYRGVVVTFTCSDGDMSASSSVRFSLGVGASMENVYTGMSFTTNSVETFSTIPGSSMYFPISISAGSRIGVMYEEPSGTPNTGYSAVLLGIPA